MKNWKAYTFVGIFALIIAIGVFSPVKAGMWEVITSDYVVSNE